MGLEALALKCGSCPTRLVPDCDTYSPFPFCLLILQPITIDFYCHQAPELRLLATTGLFGFVLSIVCVSVDNLHMLKLSSWDILCPAASELLVPPPLSFLHSFSAFNDSPLAIQSCLCFSWCCQVTGLFTHLE
jgi:hypothetical protein